MVLRYALAHSSINPIGSRLRATAPIEPSATTRPKMDARSIGGSRSSSSRTDPEIMSTGAAIANDAAADAQV